MVEHGQPGEFDWRFEQSSSEMRISRKQNLEQEVRGQTETRGLMELKVTKEGLVTAMIGVAILRISCLLILQVDSEQV